jgi:hypothetical protein
MMVLPEFSMTAMEKKIDVFGRQSYMFLGLANES